jgi:hypothetical protein
MVDIFGITMASFSCHVFLAVTEPGIFTFLNRFPLLVDASTGVTMYESGKIPFFSYLSFEWW